MTAERGGFRILKAEAGTLSHGDTLPKGTPDFLRGAPHSIATYMEGLAIVVPDSPYVPIKSGSHFMIAPYSEANHDIGDLPSRELDILSAVILTHTTSDDPKKIVSINIGKENEPLRRATDSPIRKRSPRTMTFLHLHFIDLPEDLGEGSTKHEVRKIITQTVPPGEKEFFRHKLIEPQAPLVEAILRKQIVANGRFSIIEQGQQRGTGHYPHLTGALDFIIPPQCTPQEMSLFLKDLDSQYRSLHRKIFGSAVVNYDELVENEFRGEPVFKPSPTIPELGIKDEQQERLTNLVNIAVGQKTADIDPLRQVYIPPSYSLGIADGVVTFVPHINTGRGGTEALGITSLRVDGNKTGNEIRHKRSVESARTTLEKTVLTYPDLFPRKLERILPRLGLDDAGLTAEAIASISSLTDVQGVKELVLREPTKDYMFKDVPSLTERIAQSNDRAVIWTEGEVEYQFAKVGSSGIDTDAIKPYAAKDKIPLLKEIVRDQLEVGHHREIVIADDKFKKLKSAHKALTEMQTRGELDPSISIRLMWVAHDPKTYPLPKSEEDLKFLNERVQRVRGIAELIHNLYPLQTDSADPRLILLDYDRTLLNTQFYLMNLGRVIDEYLAEQTN